MALFTVTIGAYANQPPSQLGTRTLILDYNELYTFSLTDFTATVPVYQDPEGDGVAFVKITQLPATTGDLTYNAITVTLNQEITAADITSGLLKYQCDPAELNGYVDNFKFDIQDTGSGLYSGLFTGLVDIKVGEDVNDPPNVVGDGTATIDYGETLVFTSAMFTTGTTPVYSDPEGDNPAAVKILTLPALGLLLYNGTAVSVNQIITVADIDAGLLTYVPDLADIDGDSQLFTFAVSDTGSGGFTA